MKAGDKADNRDTEEKSRGVKTWDKEHERDTERESACSANWGQRRPQRHRQGDVCLLMNRDALCRLRKHCHVSCRNGEARQPPAHYFLCPQINRKQNLRVYFFLQSDKAGNSCMQRWDVWGKRMVKNEGNKFLCEGSVWRGVVTSRVPSPGTTQRISLLYWLPPWLQFLSLAPGRVVSQLPIPLLSLLLASYHVSTASRQIPYE